MKTLIALLLMTGSALGQAPCKSIAEDKSAVMESGAADYLGVINLPFTDGLVVAYRLRANNFVLFSPIIGGCVSPQTFPLGPFKARVGV